ncbi:unnamed protein product [Prorocentrum cordatum]|uniref:Uncharacterized protein n=1 Tax=Prorocentrum cordatum TaxID=2364126 RepID=A0ABN9V072_9DINO|nr:unnamed protein product [Polarella glacialis]
MADARETGAGVAFAEFVARRVAAVGRILERWRYRGALEMLDESPCFQDVPDVLDQERRSKRAETFGISRPRAADGQFSILESHAIASTADGLYNAWFKELQDFATSIDRALDSAKSADAAMADFADYLFLEGLEEAELLKARAAAVWHLADLPPWGKLRLPRFQRAVKGYTNLDPGIATPPAPWEITCRIARQLAEVLKSVLAYLAIPLMLAAHLRSIDPRSLKEEDLCPPSASSQWWAWKLHPAERGDKSNIGLCDESILLDASYLPDLGECVVALMTGGPARKLFNIGPSALLSLWKVAMRQLGCPAGAKYVPCQLRHGGPSHDRLAGCRRLPENQRRGRWLAEGAVRRYEASARAQQEWARSSAAQQLEAREGPGPPRYGLDLYAGTTGISQALARTGIDGSAWDALFSVKADLADPQKMKRLARRTPQTNVAQHRRLFAASGRRQGLPARCLGAWIAIACSTWSREDASAAVELNPANTKARYRRAIARTEMGRAEEAMRDAEQAGPAAESLR